MFVISTEAKETIQPDATKSNIDQAGEALTDLTDRKYSF